MTFAAYLVIFLSLLSVYFKYGYRIGRYYETIDGELYSPFLCALWFLFWPAMSIASLSGP